MTVRKSTALFSLFLCSALIAMAGTPAGSQAGWPVLHHYDQDHIARIALPLGGIGTGTVSLGGRGNLRDWELMSRPGKGFNPGQQFGRAPFFALFAKRHDGKPITRLLEGPVELSDYEGVMGVTKATNHGFPRFRSCTFDAAYPLGQVSLSDPEVPVAVRIKAFNPLIPTDEDASGIPVAVLTFVLTNTTSQEVVASVSGSMQNFIGNDGVSIGPARNKNIFRAANGLQGIFMSSDGVDDTLDTWGTMALTTTATSNVTARTSWVPEQWGTATLDFWDDFSDDGKLEERPWSGEDAPMASLAAQATLPPHGTKEITFLLTWHFPNRRAWATENVGNFYATQYRDAWDVGAKFVPRSRDLEDQTVKFVRTVCSGSVPDYVKEAALSNLSALRTQTSFRTRDGFFFGWEGCGDTEGCCLGLCTHVWNYEQATAFLFGRIAKLMRRVEFGYATNEDGLMSFRINLPVQSEGDTWNKAAADGQMGTIMKIYRDWQLSGDDGMLRELWPHIKSAIRFCWIPGGWDSDRDGVMDGCQHNTMDVEYFGPNGQMQLWYLGALRAEEEMARYIGEQAFADTCRFLFEDGSHWTDRHMFNGEYYEQIVMPPMRKSAIAPGLIIGGGTKNFTDPDYQLGRACLVDQLVGQYMAHICGLGYLVEPDHVRATLKSIMKYNHRSSFADHFNCLRSFALGDEAALLMASYPKGRPRNPFPYFSEVMTGFEYTAAVGMIYEGQKENGLRCYRDVRDRYDGRKRSPFDEAECGHHYARAMASWAGLVALTGFHYSGVTRELTFDPVDGTYFWSNGYAYGAMTQRLKGGKRAVEITVVKGTLPLSTLALKNFGRVSLDGEKTLRDGDRLTVEVARKAAGAQAERKYSGAYVPHFTAAPKIIPSTRISLDTAIAVTMTTAAEGAAIHYTLDGSEPTVSSPVSAGTLLVDKSATLSARSFLPGRSPSPIVSVGLTILDGKTHGIRYKYYEGVWQKLPRFDSLTAKRTGKIYDLSVDAIEKRNDHFAILFEGLLDIPRDGEYTFFVNSDDGSRMFIDGNRVVDNDGSHGATERNGTVTLTAGKHPFRLEYFEDTEGEVLEVFVKGPGMPRQPVPAAMYVGDFTGQQ